MAGLGVVFPVCSGWYQKWFTWRTTSERKRRTKAHWCLCVCVCVCVCVREAKASLWSHWRATVAQIAEKVNACYDRQMSEHTVPILSLRGTKWIKIHFAPSWQQQSLMAVASHSGIMNPVTLHKDCLGMVWGTQQRVGGGVHMSSIWSVHLWDVLIPQVWST